MKEKVLGFLLAASFLVGNIMVVLFGALVLVFGISLGYAAEINLSIPPALDGLLLPIVQTCAGWLNEAVILAGLSTCLYGCLSLYIFVKRLIKVYHVSSF